MRLSPAVLMLALLPAMSACGEKSTQPAVQGYGANPKLPAPEKALVPTMNIAPAIGWKGDAKPVAAAGLQVAAFAKDLAHPRWLYVLPNGDVLVAESDAPPKPAEKGVRAMVQGKVMQRAGSDVGSANRITLLRDADGDGVAEVRSVFLSGLNSPFGMALVGNDFYVANADSIWRFPYKTGETKIDAAGVKFADLPGGPRNHHWTKNILASRDGSKIYATVGSNSNAAENGFEEEKGRAAIWEFDRATGKGRLFGAGLRNPNGLAWEPKSGALWTAVNERDELGNDLVPDYMTSVKDGGFYGWPYSYYGQNVDVRVKPQDPGLVARAIMPDYALGSHTASLGLTFANNAALLPASLRQGAFIGQHGSWNRKPKAGYKVIFVPFVDGHPAGMPSDVLTGFLNQDERAQGRPVGVIIDKRGALLVADDVGGRVWRVAAAK